MPMRLQFTVTYLSGEKATVESRPATEVAFERKFDRNIASMFFRDASGGDVNVAQVLAELRSDCMYFLAWHSARSDKPYEEWLELVNGIEWDFVDTADPTNPAVPAGS